MTKVAEWICLDCNIPVELTINGRCGKCGGNAVTHAEGGLKPPIRISLSATLSTALENVMVRVQMIVDEKPAGSMTLTRDGWQALKGMVAKVGGQVSESEYSPEPIPDKGDLLKRFRSSNGEPIGSRTISQLLHEKDRQGQGSGSETVAREHGLYTKVRKAGEKCR